MIFGNKELTEKADALQAALDEREQELATVIAQRDEQATNAERLQNELEAAQQLLNESQSTVESLTGKLSEATSKIETLETEVASLPDKANELAIQIAAKAGHEPLQIDGDPDVVTKTHSSLAEAIADAKNPIEAAKIRREYREKLTNPTR
jgi:chromosome segregation ATPase